MNRNSHHYVTGNFTHNLNEKSNPNGAMSRIDWNIKLDTDNDQPVSSPVSGNKALNGKIPARRRIGLK